MYVHPSFSLHQVIVTGDQWVHYVLDGRTLLPSRVRRTEMARGMAHQLEQHLTTFARRSTRR